MHNIGKIIIISGIIIVVIGLIIYFFGNFFAWFGNLPGDIKIKKEKYSFFMPITTMIIISIIFSLIIYVIKKLFY